MNSSSGSDTAITACRKAMLLPADTISEVPLGSVMPFSLASLSRRAAVSSGMPATAWYLARDGSLANGARASPRSTGGP